MTTFHRYVAIGDSSTEGLEDPDGDGGYRGWADRLAETIARAQTPPLYYANLAVRGLRLGEIRQTQFVPALAMRPDLLTIFGGVNDLIGVGHDLSAMQADLDSMFGEARARGCTVLTFTLPDPRAMSALLGRRMKERFLRWNEVIRAAAERSGTLLMDFEEYPVAKDPRLWFEDRLHGNDLGHARVAAALAWRLGIDGADESWAEPLPEPAPRPRRHEQLVDDVEWARRYLAPWLGKGIRRVPHGHGITAKRPVLTPVPKQS